MDAQKEAAIVLALRDAESRLNDAITEASNNKINVEVSQQRHFLGTYYGHPLYDGRVALKIYKAL